MKAVIKKLSFVFFCLLGMIVFCRGVFADQMERPITAWPFFMREIGKDKAETDLFWPFFHYERAKTHERYAFRPFIFSTEKDPARDFRKTSVIWPLSIYEHEGPKTTYHLFPLYWYQDAPEDNYSVFFPVYWNGERKGKSYFHLWPLFGVKKNGPSYTEYSTLYPLFRYGSDATTGEREINAPWPLIQYRAHTDSVSHRVLPLYFYSRTASENSGFVFPYYWSKKPDHGAQGIFPLWYSSHGQSGRTDLVVPFYYRSRTADETQKFITPLYFSRERADSSLSLLFPFYLSSDSADNHTRYVFPLYFSSGTEERSFRTFFPLYYDLRTADSRLRIAVPLYLGNKTGSTDLSMFFPFYYHQEDRTQRSAFTYFFPFYGSYQRGDTVSRHLVLFPLYSAYQDKSSSMTGWDALWPLLHHAESPSLTETRVLPFYLHKRAPNDEYTIGFPLYWSFSTNESSIRHFIPFYGVHRTGDWYEKKFFVGPIYMDTRDDHAGLSRQDALFYMYSRLREGDRERSWLVPFYYHREDPGTSVTLGSLALLPPYFINSHQEDHDLFHIWPFYGSTRSGTYEEKSVFWPLIRFGNDPAKDESITHILLYYGDRKGDNSRALLFPVWFHRSSPRETGDGSLFLHWYTYDTATKQRKLSIVWFAYPELAIFKLENAPGKVKQSFFPLYSYARDERTDSTRWSALLFLYSYESKGEYELESDILWKVVTYERKDPSTHDFRVLWRFIRSTKTEKSSVFEFNPFYYSEREEGKGSYWAVLGGLFGVETIGDKKKYRVFWIF